ncbi:hypothetical protein [Arthrobacter sp. KBS0702]|uniref:hypothetical protein n=1 Tax=Arthrobacter sp. KBS0702 TaxID=2578107 RepID=UPI0021BD4A52|nr:hypothetical protein [Arthrobacter sp. KBS0702]
MSTTGDAPEPEQPDDNSQDQGRVPPEPGQPGAEQPEPGQPGGPGLPAGSRFRVPAHRPRTFNEVLPLGGYSGMFTVPAMPTELTISYWVWVIGGLLGLLAGVIGLFGALVLFVVSPPAGILLLLLVLVALALAGAQITLAMKMKEGWEWARFALTIAAGVSLVLAAVSAGVAGGGSWPGFLISLAATVLMWMPNSQPWFSAENGRF